MVRIFYSLILFSVLNCASTHAEKMKGVEEALYSGDYETALPKMRSLVSGASSRDRLLYLMEAGVLLHTKGDYKASNKAFQDAEAIADTEKTSVTGETLAFLISDSKSNFKGESFEHVMIKMYIALNYLCLNELENAKRYFKKVSFEQKEMKFSEAKYRQNLLARYLDALASEHLGQFNDARVEYRNILEIEPGLKEVLADRYVLALKEKDGADQSKFGEGKNYIDSYDKDIKKIPYDQKMGELIIINQAGKAAVKESRGKLMDDPIIREPLSAAIEGSLRSNSSEGIDLGIVLATLSSAEHPIPEYRDRDVQTGNEVKILINGKEAGKTRKLADYSGMAKSNFNDNLNSIITKNIASIATKAVTVAIAAQAAKKAAEGSGKEKNELLGTVVGMIVSAIGGYGMSQTLAPDLRCWRTSPSNFQAKRIFLEPGDYTLSFEGQGKTPDPINIKIESGKPLFITFRSL